MIENHVQLPEEQPPVTPPPVSTRPNNTLLFVGLGFIITLMVMIPLLFFTQFPKKNPPSVATVTSTPTPSVAFSAASFLIPTNTPNPTQIALTPLPAPTTLIKEQYSNPFDSKTQAVNPFGSSGSGSNVINPFDTFSP